jgi:hypothetical protein
MKFLYPSGGLEDNSFGVMITPGRYGISAGIRCGLDWAADNQAFTKGFNPDVFFPWLNGLMEYRSTCLFVSCPDVVGNSNQTLDLFDKWCHSFAGWPVAFVAQDGQETKEFPDDRLWDCLFIGGSTKWKMSDGAIECIQRAQKLGKRIHIGRVNYYNRYRHFAQLDGSEEFTCDGTRNRFEGKDATIKDWKKYMASPKQYGLFVSYRHNRR